MQNIEINDEIDLREYIIKYFSIIRKKKKIIFSMLLISIIISIVILSFIPHQYKARAFLKIGKVRDNSLETPETIMEIMKTTPVLDTIAKSLNLPQDEQSLEKLKNKFTITKKAGLLEISGKSTTPQQAVDLVNMVSNFILERHKDFFAQGKQILKEYIDDSNIRLKEFEGEIQELNKKISQLERTNSEAQAIIAQGYMTRLENTLRSSRELQVALRERRMEESYATEATSIDVPVRIPELPFKPKKKLIVLITVFISFIISSSFFVVIEYFQKGPKEK